ncbi:hypothetical protein ACHAW5_003667 [Stephanodiscus triporus]|uniref:Uncharacterized protein n=1 Tax=Stephanodiscus triporus TaxID=2934178 RepID=A0ABD3PL16_9STRA
MALAPFSKQSPNSNQRRFVGGENRNFTYGTLWRVPRYYHGGVYRKEYPPTKVFPRVLPVSIQSAVCHTTSCTAMTTTKLRPTPSTLDAWENFPTVNDDIAQMRLARAMGYPPSWRVVRSLIQVPIPEDLAKQMKDSGAAVSTNEGGLHVMTAVRDRIYAGHPASQPDGYYNHAAALLACSKMPWRPEFDDVIHDNNDDDYDDDQYCSTSHRNKGGQLKGREAKFGVGDIVEVLYDEDEDVEPEWYEATILKKVEYQDDIRYDVHYTVDDAIQSNIREEKIRASAKIKKKKKSTPKATAPKAASKTTPKTNPKVTPKKQGGNKRAAGSSSGTVTSKKRRGRPSGSRNKKKVEAEEESPADTLMDDIALDEGDPPWRTDGHEYLSRKLKFNQKIGTVVGWIAETDVDSEGNPGFVCSKTGVPARLFHAMFDDFVQDFEEWELTDCFVEK